MRLLTALAIYRLLLPLLFIAAFPGWLIKMLKRGGFGTHLGERAAIYKHLLEYETCGAVHFHAVSVGEAMLALKLIREWKISEPDRSFVLATGTATGHAVASAAEISGLRVTYSPLDFQWMVRRYLDRFEPSQIVLLESEVWPHLLLECQRRNIPVRLVNARMSPRSSRRITRFAAWLRPIYSLLDTVAIQFPADADIWKALGITESRIHLTGSLKFDPSSGPLPTRREEFQQILDATHPNSPIILAASTHAGEDVYIASAIRQAQPNARIVLVPRHAERADAVKTQLEYAGFFVTLRSSFLNNSHAVPSDSILLIDTTGELRDWTAHADIVIIGKSFLSSGGQNPCEAILAEKPLLFGPHMENFQPLAQQLINDGGALCARTQDELATAVRRALDPATAATMTRSASQQLAQHAGATCRILSLLNA